MTAQLETSIASKLYHTLYPKSNFFNLPNVNQQNWEEAIRRLKNDTVFTSRLDKYLKDK